MSTPKIRGRPRLTPVRNQPGDIALMTLVGEQKNGHSVILSESEMAACLAIFLWIQGDSNP